MAQVHGSRDFFIDERPLSADVVLLRPVGELDMLTSPTLLERLLDQLSRRRHVVLDCSAVEFLSSGGIQALLEAHQSAQELNAVLHVAGTAHRVVARPLEITGVDRTIRLVDEPAEVFAERLVDEEDLDSEVG